MAHTGGIISYVTIEEVEMLNRHYGKPFTVKDWLTIIRDEDEATIECCLLVRVLQGEKKRLYRGKIQRPGSIESGVTVLLDLLGKAYRCLGKLTILEIRQAPNILGDTAVKGEVLTEFLFSDQDFLRWSLKAIHRDGYCSAMNAACKAMQWLIHQRLGHMLPSHGKVRTSTQKEVFDALPTFLLPIS